MTTAFRNQGGDYPKVSVEEALSLTLENVHSLTESAERVPVQASLGRITSISVYSARNIPNYPTSILDGFAVNAAAIHNNHVLRIHSESLAGKDCSSSVPPDVAVYVTTGGRIPDGLTAVIAIESCTIINDTVQFASTSFPLQSGQNIREPGSDTTIGDEIIPSNHRIDAGDIATMTACGIMSVECIPRIRIGVLSTGAEIVSGEVPDANRAFFLCELQDNPQVHVIDHGVMADSEEKFTQLILSGEYDFLITTGSVSKGRTDYFKQILANDARFNILFGQVDLKPGKPTTVAKFGQKMIFCLPGNPASCFVTYNLFVLPAIRMRCGSRTAMLEKIKIKKIISNASLKPDFQRPEYLRAIASIDGVNGGVFARLIDGHQRSSRVASIAGGVNCFVIIPPGLNLITTDRELDAVLLHDKSMGVCVAEKIESVRPTTESKAQAFDKLVSWLQNRTDVENIELMNLAGFCRNCLSKWLGGDLHQAREYVYGMDYEEWKKVFRKGEKREHDMQEHHACASSIMPPVGFPHVKGEACILTVSDRAFKGIYEDKSGPAIREFFTARFPSVTIADSAIVPDESDSIREYISHWSMDSSGPRLIVVTGGTGHGVRDVTPETVEPMLEKKSTGLVHFLLSKFVTKNPLFALTRPVIGTVGNTFIICLPGHPEAVKDGLQILQTHIERILIQLTS